jgi:hypothetical protein
MVCLAAASSRQMLNLHQPLNMKWILLAACGCLLIFTTGCLSSREEWRGHANNANFGGMALGPPALVVWAPVAATHPQGTIAR